MHCTKNDERQKSFSRPRCVIVTSPPPNTRHIKAKSHHRRHISSHRQHSPQFSYLPYLSSFTSFDSLLDRLSSFSNLPSCKYRHWYFWSTTLSTLALSEYIRGFMVGHPHWHDGLRHWHWTLQLLFWKCSWFPTKTPLFCHISHRPSQYCIITIDIIASFLTIILVYWYLIYLISWHQHLRCHDH